MKYIIQETQTVIENVINFVVNLYTLYNLEAGTMKLTNYNYQKPTVKCFFNFITICICSPKKSYKLTNLIFLEIRINLTCLIVWGQTIRQLR